MEQSQHTYTDRYGYRCTAEIINLDEDVAVFDSMPHGFFDFRKHGIKIRRSRYEDYRLILVIRDGRIYLREFSAQLSYFSRKRKLLGAEAQSLGDGTWRTFRLADIPLDYSGILRIGADFDERFWRHDEKASPIPFSPDVYRQNGHIRFENGVAVEKELNPPKS